jgi:uncharacterized ubiquitin-like protein YukD
MDPLFINHKDGVICSRLDPEISLGRLIYLIKDTYPKVSKDDIKIINNGQLLTNNEQSLSNLDVQVNIDRLRVIPATSWKKFNKNYQE